MELNFLHQWPAEFTQVNKQRAHKDRSLYEEADTVSQQKQHDFTPRTAGPGVLHGVLQTGSNK